MAPEPLSADLWRRPADEGARVLALGLLDRAGQAAARLGDPADRDALHDFRVALRRLRSSARAYRSVLGESVPGKLRRRLRRLAAATGAARDAEVHVAWLEAVVAEMPSRRRAGPRWLLARLEQAREKAYDEVRARGVARFRRLDADLRRRLSSLTVRLGEKEQQTLAQAAADRVEAQAEELQEDFTAWTEPPASDELHRTRVAAKRLRYLVEPLRQEWEPAAVVVDALKALQELLGEIHDGDELARLLAEEMAAAAAGRARRAAAMAYAQGGGEVAPSGERITGRPGLRAVLERLGDERKSRLKRLAAEWSPETRSRFFADVRRLAAGLTSTPVSAPDEP